MLSLIAGDQKQHGLPSRLLGLGNTLLPALSPHYLLGTDQYGNDVLSRLLYGGRVSIEVGVGTVAIGIALGGALGAIAGLKGGMVETAIMRTLEVFLALLTQIDQFDAARGSLSTWLCGIARRKLWKSTGIVSVVGT